MCSVFREQRGALKESRSASLMLLLFFLFVGFNNLIKPNIFLLSVTVCWWRLITRQIVLLMLEMGV